MNIQEEPAGLICRIWGEYSPAVRRPSSSRLTGSVRLRGKRADELRFMPTVGPAIWIEDFVKPDGRPFQGVRAIPGIPRQPGLRFAGNQAPVDRSDTMFLRNRQRVVEGAARAARHVFGADEWPVILLQPFDALLEILRPAVVVEGDDVGLIDLNATHGVERFVGGPVSVPDAAGERLRGVLLASPCEDLGKKVEDQFDLVLRICLAVRTVVAIVRLIPHIPGKNAVVLREGSDYSLNIGLKPSRGYWDGSSSAAAPGLCTHPELCTPGIGGCCGPSFGTGSQQESNNTNTGRM